MLIIPKHSTHTPTHTYTHTHIHAHIHTSFQEYYVVFISEQTYKALKLVINKRTAVTTFTILSIWKLHQDICHLKFTKNVYVYFLGHLTNALLRREMVNKK